MQRSRSTSQRRKLIEKPRRRESDDVLSSNLLSRRQVRQRCSDDSVVAENKTITTSTSSLRTQRRRYVKSKPPRPMPGGRVIHSGEGTLTEVSNAAYVAYGSTAMATTRGDIHLVVPVRDELQEVTDVEDNVHDDAKNEAEFNCASIIMETQSQGELSDLLRLDELPLETPSTHVPSWFSTPPPSLLPTLPPVSLPPITDMVGEFESGGITLGHVFGEDGTAFRAPSFSGTASRVFSSHGATTSSSRAARCRGTVVDRDRAKSDAPDQSYFNLADALLPETTRTPNLSFSPQNWDVISPKHPRCGMAPGELPTLPAPAPPYPLFMDAADRINLPPMNVPSSFSSYSFQQRFRPEITPGSITPSNFPPLYSVNHHPFLPPPSNLLI